MTIDDVYRYVSRHRYGVLSTIAANGAAQSALVGIAVTDELELIFDTVRSTRKYSNLLADPRCSFVIGWDAEQTIQYEGIAEELTAPRLEMYQRVYFEVFADGPERLAWPGIVYFLVRPTWIRYSDFAQVPPLIQEFTFDRSSPRGSSPVPSTSLPPVRNTRSEE